MTNGAHLVERLGFGTMAIGGQFADVTDDDAEATLAAALDAGIRLFDAAPQYGCGLAEERLGRAIRRVPRTSIEISTKVGKRVAPYGSGGECQRSRLFPGGHPGEMVFDYSYDGTLAIVDRSLNRLGVSYLDHVLLHDLTRHFHGREGVFARVAEAMAGAIPALLRLVDEGVVRHIGVGLKDIDIAALFLREGLASTILVPGRMTLVDRSAQSEGLIAASQVRGAHYIAAAPFDSGILATGPRSDALSGYKPATDDVRARVATIQQVCARHGVPLLAAALQWPLTDPGVSRVLAGMRSPVEVAANIGALRHPIPDALWAELSIRP